MLFLSARPRLADYKARPYKSYNGVKREKCAQRAQDESKGKVGINGKNVASVFDAADRKTVGAIAAVRSRG